MTDETEVTASAGVVAPADAPKIEPQAAEPAKTEAPNTEPQGEPERPKIGLPKSVQDRINVLTVKASKEAEARQEAERKAAELEAQLRAFQQSPQPQAPQSPTPQPQSWLGQPTQPDIHALARQYAEQEAFNQKCNDLYNKGKAQIPAFDDAVSNLRAIAGDSPAYAELLKATTSIDDGHKLIAHLGANLDEASRLMSLPPIQMGFEIARLTQAVNKSAPISQAPAPIRPVTGSVTTEPEPDENGNFKSHADYLAWREKTRRKR